MRWNIGGMRYDKESGCGARLKEGVVSASVFGDLAASSNEVELLNNESKAMIKVRTILLCKETRLQRDRSTCSQPLGSYSALFQAKSNCASLIRLLYLGFSQPCFSVLYVVVSSRISSHGIIAKKKNPPLQRLPSHPNSSIFPSWRS